jgi:cardiolipin synthase
MLRIARFTLALIFTAALGIAAAMTLRFYAAGLYNIIGIASIAAVIYILIKQNNPYSIVWVVVIFVIPVLGLFLYLLFTFIGTVGIRKKRFKASLERGKSYLYKDPEIYTEQGATYPYRKRIAGYLGRKDQPLYKNTLCTYYPLGELHFDAMLNDMENAERFIFVEYFIISRGILWERMKEILIRKARQGVEVRVMTDDIGSVLTFSKTMAQELQSHGIQFVRFNDIHGILSRFYFNFRNHQKITVIDGNIGYTGGTNVADEYVNAFPKYGHWKDTAIRLEGDAVWSLTVAFLQMWDGDTGTHSDYDVYRPTVSVSGAGFYQPFTDGPANDADNIAKNIYKSFIYNAKKYVYITTPYLIIDANMIDALRIAAKGGTDVRIIVPKKWDKWFVHMVTLSNYRTLLEAGVRIFEYTPGFIHAKTILSDDDHAVIGTINMDYRSFYLHFENGVWLCGAPAVRDIKTDLLRTLAMCEEVHLDKWKCKPFVDKCLQNALRLFAVLF